MSQQPPSNPNQPRSTPSFWGNMQPPPNWQEPQITNQPSNPQYPQPNYQHRSDHSNSLFGTNTIPTQPPMMQPAPMQKKKAWYKKPWVIVLLIFLALATCSGINNAFSHSVVATTSTTANTITSATQAPKATVVPMYQPVKPTQAPTNTTANTANVTHGTPHLGGNISAFYGKYGTPSSTNGSDAFWSLNQDGSLTVDVRDTGGGTVGYLSLITPDDWSKAKIRDYLIGNFSPSGTQENTSTNTWWKNQGGDPYDPIAYTYDAGKFFLHISSGSGWMNIV